MERKNSRRRVLASSTAPAAESRHTSEEATTSSSFQFTSLSTQKGGSQPAHSSSGTKYLRSSYLIALLSSFSIVLVLYAFTTSWPFVGILNLFGGVSRVGLLQQLNFGTENFLHPEEHVSRLPTILLQQWNVTQGFERPDGVLKRVYLINQMFPGPTIEARSGDRLIIQVRNCLQEEGLAIHWHGLRMRGANEMDGAVGLTQNPIASGDTFTYDFVIGDDESGTFWYHGHEKTQRDDGLYGALIVHKPHEQRNEKLEYQYDQELPLLIGDWYHRPATDVLNWYMSSRGFGNEPVPDSLLVNGQGKFDCSMAVPARPLDCISNGERQSFPNFAMEAEKRYRLRIINVGSLAGFSVRFLGATLKPFQVDGGNEIHLSESETIGVLYPGERVDAVLAWSGSSPKPQLEIILDDENFGYPNPALTPVQNFPIELHRQERKSSKPSQTTSPSFDSTKTLDFQNLQTGLPSTGAIPAFLPVKSPSNPSTFVIYSTTLKLAKHHNRPMGFINRTSWSPQSSPAVPLISLPRSEWDHNQFVPLIPYFESDFNETALHGTETSKNSNDGGWVDLVINNLDHDGGHPFHLHGHSFYVLSVYPDPGRGRPATAAGGTASYTFNPFKTRPGDSPGGEYNLFNPLMKDTLFVPRRGYAVIRFKADNKGIWMLHCHVGWHLGSGMAMGWQVG